MPVIYGCTVKDDPGTYIIDTVLHYAEESGSKGFLLKRLGPMPDGWTKDARTRLKTELGNLQGNLYDTEEDRKDRCGVLGLLQNEVMRKERIFLSIKALKGSEDTFIIGIGAKEPWECTMQELSLTKASFGRMLQAYIRGIFATGQQPEMAFYKNGVKQDAGAVPERHALFNRLFRGYSVSLYDTDLLCGITVDTSPGNILCRNTLCEARAYLGDKAVGKALEDATGTRLDSIERQLMYGQPGSTCNDIWKLMEILYPGKGIAGLMAAKLNRAGFPTKAAALKNGTVAIGMPVRLPWEYKDHECTVGLSKYRDVLLNAMRAVLRLKGSWYELCLSFRQIDINEDGEE